MSDRQIFSDRRDAGAALAAQLSRYQHRHDVVVLALPRGGVPVAYEVAGALGAPLDVFVVRKLGVPGRRELAMGAIAPGGVRVLDRQIIAAYGIPEAAVERTAREERLELERRERAYREDRDPVAISGQTVLLIDDGLATGATMKAAVQAARAGTPKRVVVAVPVGAPSTCAEMAEIADEVVCVSKPEPFYAVGQWYADFSQTSDDEVRKLLRESRATAGTR
ncbi:MAG: phosphoribosyltransferase [Betaproteobacteria bacterium]